MQRELTASKDECNRLNKDVGIGREQLTKANVDFGNLNGRFQLKKGELAAVQKALADSRVQNKKLKASLKWSLQAWCAEQTETFAALGTGREVVKGASIQEWTVPETKKYSIKVWGAAGGSHGKNGAGGRGIKITGEFPLSKGDRIKILVGHKGIGQPGMGEDGG